MDFKNHRSLLTLVTGIIGFIIIILIFVSCSNNKNNINEKTPKDLFFSIMSKNETNKDNYICVVEIDGRDIETVYLNSKNSFIRELIGTDIKEYVKEGYILADNIDDTSFENFNEIEILLASQLKKDYLEPIITDFNEDKIIIDGIEYGVVIGKGNIERKDLDYLPISWYRNLNLTEDEIIEVEIVYDENNGKLLQQKLTDNSNASVVFNYSDFDEVMLEYPQGLTNIGNYEYSQDFEKSGKVNGYNQNILLKLSNITSETNRVFTPIVIGNILYGGFSQGMFYSLDSYKDSEDNLLNNNVYIKNNMSLYTYSNGNISDKRTVTDLTYIDDLLNNKKLIKVNTNIEISTDNLGSGSFSTFLIEPYPVQSDYQDNKIMVDLDKNGVNDEITLSNTSDPLKIKKDIGVALNKGAKKVFTTESTKFIFIDVIDIDSDGYSEILGFEVTADGSSYADLVMLKFIDDDIVRVPIVQI